MSLKIGDYVRYKPQGYANHSWLDEGEIVKVIGVDRAQGEMLEYRNDQGSQSAVRKLDVTRVDDKAEQLAFEMRLAEYKLAEAQKSSRAARERVHSAKADLDKLHQKRRGLPVSVNLQPEIYRALTGLCDDLRQTPSETINTLLAAWYERQEIEI